MQSNLNSSITIQQNTVTPESISKSFSKKLDRALFLFTGSLTPEVAEKYNNFISSYDQDDFKNAVNIIKKRVDDYNSSFWFIRIYKRFTTNIKQEKEAIAVLAADALAKRLTKLNWKNTNNLEELTAEIDLFTKYSVASIPWLKPLHQLANPRFNFTGLVWNLKSFVTTFYTKYITSIDSALPNESKESQETLRFCLQSLGPAETMSTDLRISHDDTSDVDEDLATFSSDSSSNSTDNQENEPLIDNKEKEASHSPEDENIKEYSDNVAPWKKPVLKCGLITNTIFNNGKKFEINTSLLTPEAKIEYLNSLEKQVEILAKNNTYVVDDITKDDLKTSRRNSL